ncbi:MAG: ferritin family protein, partial [Planctomycetes bacterium]|nr:ferritin family protein [Planctomycetota bacterium]
MQFDSVDALLNFAIKEEADAAAFYTELSSKMEKPYMKKVFSDFAKEELGHKAKLEGVKQGKYLDPSSKKILDLKIGDFLVEDSPEAGMDYQSALVLAMKKEKAAFQLYSSLADSTNDEKLRGTLTALAQEE